MRDTLRFFEVERPTFSYDLRRAIAEGYLVPYRIYRAMTVKTATEGGFEVRRDELDWSAMDETARAEFEELFGASEEDEPRQGSRSTVCYSGEEAGLPTHRVELRVHREPVAPAGDRVENWRA